MPNRDRHWREPFQINSGLVWGSSYDHYRRREFLASDRPADMVVVLFDHEDPEFGEWPGSRARIRRRIHWPKLETPPDEAELAKCIREALDTIRNAETVEVFCFGGHGRTGTFLACLAALDGEDPGLAIRRVRAEYCERAIGTVALEQVVWSMSDLQHSTDRRAPFV